MAQNVRGRTPEVGLVIAIFTTKFFLDFISVYREINFVIFNVVLLLSVAIQFRKIKRFTSGEVTCIFIYLLACIVAFAESLDIKLFLQFSSLIVIYLSFRTLLSGFQISDYKYVAKILFKIFFTFAFVNLVISFMLANPLEREFYNFEHANLLGSYLLLSTGFIYAIQHNNKKENTYKFTILGFAALSTSTGAFMSSLLLLLPVKSLSIRKVWLSTISLFSVSVLLYLGTSSFAPELAMKIFGPLDLIAGGGLNELQDLARYLRPIQDLGSEFDSSMIWRMYAYIIFWDFIVNEPTISLLLGNGFNGSLAVWSGIAAHNDLITILIDFGLIFFALFVVAIYKALKWVISNEKSLLPLLFILILRLLFENNINSYYLLSGIALIVFFVYFMAVNDEDSCYK